MNRITGHTLNRKLSGALTGTIKVKWAGRAEVVKWEYSGGQWLMWGASTEAKSLCVGYLEKLIEHFA